MWDEEKHNAQAYQVLVKTVEKRNHLHDLDKGERITLRLI